MSVRFFAVLCIVALVRDVSAQWSVTATATPASAVTAFTFNGAAQTPSIPTGPLGPGTIASAYSSSGGDTASSWAAWNPNPSGVAGLVPFEVSSSASVSVQAGGYANGGVTLDLLVTPPTAGAWFVTLDLATFVSGGFSSSAWFSVDVYADGVAEMTGPVGAGSIQFANMQVPMYVAGSGTVIRVAVGATAGAFFGPSSGSASARVTGALQLRRQVTPWQLQAGPAELVATPIGVDRCLLDLQASTPVTPLWTAFGFQSLNQQVLPGVTQLVSVDAILPGATFALDLPALPPGFSLYVQSLGLDQAGALFATNSLRARWF